MTSDDCLQTLLSQNHRKTPHGEQVLFLDRAISFLGAPPKSAEALPGFANSSIPAQVRPVLSRKALKGAGSCFELPFPFQSAKL